MTSYSMRTATFPLAAMAPRALPALRALRVFGVFCAVSAVSAAFVAFAAEEADGTYYARALHESVDAPALRKAAADAIARLKKERPGIERFVGAAAAEKNILAGAFAKRLEITDRLAVYLEGMLKSDEPDAPLYARQGAGELGQLLDYFRDAAARAAFLKTAPPAKTINLKDFGAKGDGARNDAPAFAAALAEAKKTGGRVILRVPAGTYLFGSFEAKRSFPADADGWRKPNPDFGREKSGPDNLHVPQLIDFKDLTIEGEDGAVLLGANPRIGFFFLRRCNYVTIRNLVFDYQQLPFTQGVVTAVDAATGIVGLKIDDGFPAPDLDYILSANSLYANTYNEEGTRLIKGATFKRFQAVRDAGDGLYELKFDNPNALKDLVAGYRLAVNARYNSQNANILRGFFSNNLLFEKLTVHAAPANVFGGLYLNNHSVVNCRITPPAGSGRLLASNADPCMIGGAVIGPYLAGNTFEHAGDDVANEYIEGQQVKSVSADGRSLVVPQGVFGRGHILSLLDPNDGTIKGETRLSASEVIPNGGGSRLTLETPFSADTPSMESLGQRAMSAAEAHEYVSLQSNIRHGLFPYVVMDRHYSGGGTVIVDNVFRHAYRGVLIKVSNALVEGNTIEGMDREAVSVMLYANHWRECNAPHNVVIRDNRLTDNGGGVSSYYQIYSTKTAPVLTPIRDLLIEDNILENTGDSRLDNCRDVRVAGNKFGAESRLKVGIARDVVLEGNDFTPPADEALSIAPTAEGVAVR